MRLKITIDTKQQSIPFEYHGYLQGIIYHALSEESGSFLHDTGYGDDRIYKLFVYSELIGKYRIENRKLVFTSPVSFYISSVSSDMLNELFMYFNTVEEIHFKDMYFDVLAAEPVDDIEYHEDGEYVLQTISPITCYKTDEKNFTSYFHPKSQDFECSIQENLHRKYETLYGKSPEEILEIVDIIKCKKTLVRYKGMVYEAYITTMKVKASDAYLKLLMHTGLGAKNSAGFGMVKIVG